MRTIETSRLLLRPFTPGDLASLSLIFSDPAVVRHLGSGMPLSREETEYALRRIINHWERNGFGRWAAVYRPTGKLIGYGGLRNCEGTPELVYLLDRPYWGMGLATEIAKASLKFGFEELQSESIIGMTKTGNVASQRVLEKVGMTFDRTANICEMEVVCYSLSRATYLSQSNLDQGSLAA